MTRPIPFLIGALSLSAVLASCAPAQQTAAPQAQRNDGDVDARIDLEDSKRRGFPIAAPSNVPIKNTNYPIPADAIFVSPQGKDANAGTRELPTSLKNALQIAPVGGTIVFRGGDYRGGDIIVPRNLTLQAFPGESPWIKGSVIVTDWVQDGTPEKPMWRHDNWKAEFPPRGYQATVMKQIIDKNPMAANGDQTFVNGQALWQVGTKEAVGPGQFFVDYKADQLFIGDDPTGKTVESTTRDYGIFVTKRAEFDASGSIVRGLGFCHFGDSGLGVSAPNVLVENCTSAWNDGSGIVFHTWVGGVKATMPAECIARGNVCVANGSNGMSAEATRFLVEGNTLSFNNVEGFKRSWGAAGIKVIYGHDFEARDNIVEGNYATGIWMDIDVQDARVHHNLARNNQGLGIFFEISDSCIIAFNVLQNNGTGIQISNSTRARVYNNTLVDNSKAFYAQWWQRTQNEGKKPIAGIAPGETYVTRDNVFVNNLIVYTKPRKATLLEAQGGPEASTARITQSNYNAYFLPADAPEIIAARWAVAPGEQQNYATFADFQRIAPTYETHSLLGGNGNPFMNAANGDFRLKAAPDLQVAPLPADIAALRRPTDAQNMQGALGVSGKKS